MRDLVKSIHSLLLPLLFAATAPAALAAELENGTFDTDLTGWTGLTGCSMVPDEDCPNIWDSTDRLGSGSSGSVIQRKDYAGGASKRILACLSGPVQGGQRWMGSAWTFLPTASPPATSWLQIAFYPEADCGGVAIDFVNGPGTSSENAWIEIRNGPLTVPEGTASLQVALRLNDTSASVPVEAYYDDVKLGIFFSAFDNLSLTDWSASVP